MIRRHTRKRKRRRHSPAAEGADRHISKARQLNIRRPAVVQQVIRRLVNGKQELQLPDVRDCPGSQKPAIRREHPLPGFHGTQTPDPPPPAGCIHNPAGTGVGKCPES